jgi:hypothetical protein
MNVFATEHPLVAQEAKEHPLPSYFGAILVVAVFLCLLFAGVVAVALPTWNSPDVPGSSWTDFSFAAVGFVMAFPMLFFFPPDDPLPMAQHIFLLVSVVVDGLFWAFVSVSLYRLLGRMRAKSPNKALHATAAAPGS